MIHFPLFPPKAGLFGRLLTLLLLLLLLAHVPLQARFTLAGRITCERVSGLTYRITLVTYTDPTLTGTDHCSADIGVWSVGATTTLYQVMEDIPRSNGEPTLPPIPTNCVVPNPMDGEIFHGTIKYNVFEDTITFPAPGGYLMRYVEPSAIRYPTNLPDPDVLNFLLETYLVVTDPLPSGVNNSPIFLNVPLSLACLDAYWTHNPGGLDPDGDSLRYTLLPAYLHFSYPGSLLSVAAGMIQPGDPLMGTNGLRIDALTGVIAWDVPSPPGLYMTAIEVAEYRNGTLMGKVRQNMAFFVEDCDTLPPGPGEKIAGNGAVYPNPTSEVLYLTWDDADTDSRWVSVIDGNGQVVIRRQLKGNGQESLPTADLPAGVYSIRVEGRAGWIRFVKQ